MKYKICSCLNSPKGSSSTLRATASGVGVVVASKLEGFVLVVGLFVVPIRMRMMKMKNTISSKKKKVVLEGLRASVVRGVEIVITARRCIVAAFVAGASMALRISWKRWQQNNYN